MASLRVWSLGGIAGFDNVLPALSSLRQMLWDIEGFIISSQDWGKRIIVVKLCMAFESGPECLEELFSAEYYLALIQCRNMGAALCRPVVDHCKRLICSTPSPPYQEEGGGGGGSSQKR